MSDGFKLVDDKNWGNFIEELKKIDWIYWLNRPYSVFMATIFWEGLREKYFKRAGFEGLAPNNNLYQFPDIYYDKKFLEKGVIFFDGYFKTHKVSDLSDMLAKVHLDNISELKRITSDKKKTIPQKVAVMSDLVKNYLPFLWITVPLEEYFNKKVALEVPKFITGDYSKFIGVLSRLFFDWHYVSSLGSKKTNKTRFYYSGYFFCYFFCVPTFYGLRCDSYYWISQV